MEIIKNEVKKVSIKDARLEAVLEADFKGKDPEGNELETTDDLTRKCSQVAHPDLQNALKRLRIHMVVICEQPEASQVTEENVYELDPELFENYEITGYSIGGTDESEGVTIIGKKLLKNGMVLNLNAPFTKFEDEEAYPHGAALSQDIDACNHEVLAYLNGKWGLVQTEFEFEDDEDGVKATVSINGGEEREINLKKLQKVSESA